MKKYKTYKTQKIKLANTTIQIALTGVNLNGTASYSIKVCQNKTKPLTVVNQ